MPYNHLKVLDIHIFINYIEKYSTSKLTNKYIESKLKVRATTRNWKTVTKLVEIIADLTRIIHSANKSRNIFFKILKYRNVKKHHNCFRLIL